MAFKIRNFASSPFRQEEDPRIKTSDTLDPNYYKPIMPEKNIAAIEEERKSQDEFKKEFDRLENLKNYKGKKVEYGSPEYEKLYNEGSVTGVTTDGEGNYLPMLALDEVDLGDVQTKRKPSKTLDYISDGLTICGMTPAYGALCDALNLGFATGRTIGNAVSDTYHGLKTGDFDYGLTGRSAKDAGFAASGLVPIAGQMASSAKLGSRFSDGAKFLQKSKLLKGIDAIHHTKAYKPIKATKVALKNLPEEFKS
jgi:hypothetical protein